QMVGGNGGNQFRQYAGQNAGNLNGYNAVQNVGNQVAQNPRIQNDGNQNQTGNGNLVAVRAEGNAAKEKGCCLSSDTAVDYSEGRGRNLTLSRREQYTELLEPIPKPQQVPQIDNNIISEVTNVEQDGETVEQHSANFEETRALYESLYQNLAVEVEKVNSVNRKLKETNADLTTELARYKNQERYFEISQEKYDKLERCYQQSVYQEKCLSKKINALHLSFAGSESRPPMLNKENYVPWLSRLLQYAKSRPNGKLIHNSIQNGPYVRKMIPKPGDANRDITEKKAKLFNEWERFTSNEGESIESYYHCFLKLVNDLKRNKHFPEKIASNLKFLNNLKPEWSRHKEEDELKAERIAKTQDPLALMVNSNNPYVFPAPHQDQSSFNQNHLQQPMPNPKDITDPTTAMNMALALMAKAFKLNYSTPTNNNQRILSNPRNKQIAHPWINMGQDRQMQMVGGNGNQNQIRNGNLVATHAEGNAAGQNGNQIRCYNCRGVGHCARNCTLRPRRMDAAYLQTQLLIAQKEEAGIQLQAKECHLMAAAADLDEIKETNSAPVYDTDGSAEVHENCDDNEIFNMFTQEEQYTELLKPIPESHQVPQNDNDVISKDTSNGLIGVQGNGNQNQIGNADLDEIKEVNANCILMANLQHASTLEEQYTELLEPIPESHQVPQNDNDVISKDTMWNKVEKQ
nr:hypothetical protein [Tanacetum cinerariifolium]